MRARLHQVFWNLLKNAIKFTPEGGLICIRTFNPRANVLTVEFNDCGEGIEPAAVPQIFAAFEQADHSVVRKFGGLGLGLTISKAIMDLHGGTIRARARQRKRLLLYPGISDHQQRSRSSSIESPALQAQKISHAGRILLVDDHPDTLPRAATPA